ncbi:MAG TPA: hypothetical protein VJU81_09715 [Methylomirabilota bacterium]|nr:hypothetical protein [Methylomirabilota bacterium]
MRRRTALATAGLGPLAFLAFPSAWTSRPAWAADTWDLRQISADERRRLLAGEALPFPVAERTDRDLAAGVVLYLPVPAARVGEHLVEAELAVRDPGVTAWGVLPERASPEDLAKLRLGPAETEEILEAQPGSVWNLSSRELEALRALRPALAGPARSGLAQASTSLHYRTVLLHRARAYRTGGLAAIEPYARRGGAVVDPGAELRLAAEDTRPLADAAPGLPDTLLLYPSLQAAGRPSQIFWVERRLQGRAAPILVHQLIDARPELAVHVERHFFVAHSYNSSQTLTGALPWGSGCLVFTVGRVSTDLVTGLGGEVKRALGRRQLRGDLTGRIERIRAALAKITPPQSP